MRALPEPRTLRLCDTHTLPGLVGVKSHLPEQQKKNHDLTPLTLSLCFSLSLFLQKLPCTKHELPFLQGRGDVIFWQRHTHSDNKTPGG